MSSAAPNFIGVVDTALAISCDMVQLWRLETTEAGGRILYVEAGSLR
jgi:hypothetical protein